MMYVSDAIYLVLRGCDIKICSLKNNGLTNFPKKMVANFPNMNVLNINGNNLNGLPEEISGWQHTLRGLSLANNRMVAFPTSAYALKALTLLDLSHNVIQELELEKISEELPSLKQLVLTGNPLSDRIKENILQFSKQSNGFAIKY